MRSPRPEPRSGLPAPYEDPWRRLGADLRAVLASLRLRLQEIWRRNGEGDLPRPAFWPAGLAALFWPLLLAALLALSGAAVLSVLRQRPLATPPSSLSTPAAGLQSAAPQSAAGPSGADHADRPLASKRGGDEAAGMVGATGDSQTPRATSGQAGIGPVGSGAAAGGAADGATGATSAAAPLASADRDGRSAAPAASAGSGPPDPAAAETPLPAPGPGPLLQELVGDPPPLWVEGLDAVPAEGLLRLRLGAGFETLAEPARRALAEEWLGRGQQLGFERLELRGPADRLLARTARVGSGMILLDSSAGRR